MTLPAGFKTIGAPEAPEGSDHDPGNEHQDPLVVGGDPVGDTADVRPEDPWWTPAHDAALAAANSEELTETPAVPSEGAL